MHRAIAPCLLLALAAAAPGCIDRPLAPQQPSTSRSSIQVLSNRTIDKIDLLFMIDSSASMADKQAILADAVPDLLRRLTQPDCVRFPDGARVVGSTVEQCPDGYHREFKPVDDIHIGVLSSALSLPGSDYCEAHNDVGLLTRAPGESGTGPDIDGRRFIVWNPGDPNGSTAQFEQLVRGVGESGCGLESSLESWYRFLVDPAPPSSWVAVPCVEGDDKLRCREPGPADTRILEQRKAFLRPDSLLAVIMLTDENDCSINPRFQGWFASADNIVLSRGTAACDTDPDSPECMSCASTAVSAAEHPECAEDQPIPHSDYGKGVRCWDQKRRFGADFLYPIERYVRGLTETHIDGVLNPVFCSEPDPNDPTVCATPYRPRDFVVLGGIVGVPWQDIAENPQDLSEGYRAAAQFSMTASQLAEQGIPAPGGVVDQTTLWDVIVGPTLPNHAPAAALLPIDPLMQESVDPREGVNPALGAPLARPDAHADANPINGHEWNAVHDEQLQFACVFDLPQPFECQPGDYLCDCSNLDGRNNPLCQDAQGNYTHMQRKAKAYPGRRHLAVLKGLGERGIPASICPSTLDTSRPDYGYRPAIEAIVDRLASTLSGTCWGEQLDPNESGEVPCIVLEATKGTVAPDGSVTCEPCEGIRRDPSAASDAAVRGHEYFNESQMNCVCEVGQTDAESGNLRACVEQQEPDPSVEGWCYLDPESNASVNTDLLGACSRKIRFVSQPRANSITFIQCRGAAY